MKVRLIATIALYLFLLSFIVSASLAGSAWAQVSPVPSLSLPLVPASVAPGGPDFMLTVNGSGFVQNSVVSWNNTPLTTTFVSASQVTAIVPASNVGNPGTASITISSPGGVMSNEASFDIRSPFPASNFGLADFAAGKVPEIPVVADFNADGQPDIALLAMGDSAVSVLLGTGSGTFAPFQEYQVNTTPQGLIARDFNNDGKLDLAVSDFFGGISILLGNGDGTFQAHIDSTSPAQSVGLAAGDFNNDGLLDIVIGLGTGNIAILLGKGDGTFQAPVQYSASSGAAYSVTTGDFNGDGILDLALSDRLQLAIQVLRGNGDGTFQSPTAFPTAGVAGDVKTADLNADGKLDLVVKVIGTISGALSILLGNGDGTFQQHIDYPTTSDPLINIADVNGDNKLDLIVPSHNSTIIFLGRGNGQFQKPNYFPTKGKMVGAAIGDFDGNGLIDIATANVDTGNISILPQLTSVLSKTLLDFGKISIGSSETKKVKLTNIGTQPLSISRVRLEGRDAGAYRGQDSCGSKVQSGATCQITIVFFPQASGRYNGAALRLKDSASRTTQVIGLRGTGID